ncbi:hypothetical protein [Acrocarpospora catenulata]|uniref:hypothetical protein n=1 Tax=Acrocarpospora catenulata TaxID=2836182 RepID=UPI001BD96697|nr:hypothetical protein [Acrocarpospora catenulata]
MSVLTTSSAFTCDHLGAATPAAAHRLTVGGAAVLTRADLLAAMVSGCAQPDQAGPPVTRKCRKVLQVNGGDATRLTVDGVPVLTTTGFAALTDGQNAQPAVPPLVPPPVPPATQLSPPLTADANQIWLRGA